MKRKLKAHLKSLDEYKNLPNDILNEIVNSASETFEASKKAIKEQKKNKEITDAEAKIRIENLSNGIY